MFGGCLTLEAVKIRACVTQSRPHLPHAELHLITILRRQHKQWLWTLESVKAVEMVDCGYYAGLGLFCKRPSSRVQAELRGTAVAGRVPGCSQTRCVFRCSGCTGLVGCGLVAYTDATLPMLRCSALSSQHISTAHARHLRPQLSNGPSL